MRRPAEDVVFLEVEGETVLLNPRDERYYALDAVGTRFWALFVEHEELEPVVAAMAAEFEVDEPTLRSDLDTLLDELAGAGLVVEADVAA